MLSRHISTMMRVELMSYKKIESFLLLLPNVTKRRKCSCLTYLMSYLEETPIRKATLWLTERRLPRALGSPNILINAPSPCSHARAKQPER